MRRVITTLWTTVLAGCSVFGVRSGYEQPPYDVIDHAAGGVEIRRYGPRLAAEIPFLRRNEVAVPLLRVSQSAVGSGPQAGRSRSVERLPEEA